MFPSRSNPLKNLRRHGNGNDLNEYQSFVRRPGRNGADIQYFVNYSSTEQSKLQSKGNSESFKARIVCYLFGKEAMSVDYSWRSTKKRPPHAELPAKSSDTGDSECIYSKNNYQH